MKAEDWISVKDRLPQVGELVLCASKQYQDWMLYRKEQKKMRKKTIKTKQYGNNLHL